MVHRQDGIRAVLPSEKGGGTWIATNEYGITLALLNWNIPVPQQSVRRSRGLIIPDLLPLMSAAKLNTALTTYELARCAPFRLFAIIPGEGAVLQWRWDGAHLVNKTWCWDLRHWFSSSASDNRAQELRGGVCSRASNDASAGSLAWLRRLHQSHENGPGAFSICVHRELVETLSYTAVSCTGHKILMVHAIGNPCNAREAHIVEIQRVDSSISTAAHTKPHRIEKHGVC